MEIETDTSRTVTEALLISRGLHDVGSRSTRRHTPCTSSLQYLYRLQGSMHWRLVYAPCLLRVVPVKSGTISRSIYGLYWERVHSTKEITALYLIATDYD